MEKAKQEVVFKPKAEKFIFQFILYIEQQGYPQRAEKFGHALYDFGYTLNNYPDKYPICKQAKLAKHKLHCAVFHKNYIFVYKLVESTLMPPLQVLFHLQVCESYYIYKLWFQ